MKKRKNQFGISFNSSSDTSDSKARKKAVRPDVFCEKVLLRKFRKMNFAKFLRTPFLQNTSGSCFCQNLTLCLKRANKRDIY